MGIKIIQKLIDGIRGKNRVNYKKILRELVKQKINKFEGKIFVIGDSHSMFFSGHRHMIFMPTGFMDINTTYDVINFFKVYHLGAALAYNLNKRQTSTQAYEKTMYVLDNKIIPPKSTIMLCYGEIDIRVHVIKQATKQNKTIEGVIDTILTNYLEYIKLLQSKGFSVICWGPIASQKDDWNQNADCPRSGTEVERNRATEIFNDKLSALAAENDFIHCSIFKELIDENYRTKPEYILDECHLAPNAMPLMFKELLEKKVLIVDKKNNSLKIYRKDA